MKKTSAISTPELGALLDRAEEHLVKSEYAEAEKLAKDVLSILNGKGTLLRDDEARALWILGECSSWNAHYDDALTHCHNALTAAEAASNLGLQSRALNGTANVQSKRGDFNTALRTAEHALALAEKAEDKKQQARALNTCGNAHMSLADYPGALDTYARSLALAEHIGDKRQLAGSLCNIGTVHRLLGDYGLALEYYGRALSLTEEINDKKFMANTLGGIGNVHWKLADFVRALDYYSRALVIAESIGNKAFVGVCLGNIGNVYSDFVDYLHALQYYARALAIAEEIGDKEAVARNLGNMGIVYHTLGDNARALDFYSRAHAIDEGYGNKAHSLTMISSIGILHYEFADYSRALDCYTRALAIAEETGIQHSVAINLGNMGMSYIASGDNTRALEYFARALDLSVRIGARKTVGHMKAGIARVERKLGNLEVAYQGFVDTLHHQRDVLKSNDDIAETLLELGGVLLEQGKTEQGLVHLKEGLRLAEEFGRKNTTSAAHKDIAGAYAQMGDVAKELEHLKKHYALEKEIYSEESKKSVEKFNMRVAIAEIEHGVEVQKLKVERMEHEITSQAIHLAAQTDLLDRFRNDLRHITREINEPIAALKKIKEKLKELPCASIDWPKFEAQFNQVHPEFKAKLAEKYPELTQMEQRIAAMVRMDLNSATIARLFCVTERAVEFHRLNLRKKLGLKEGEKLPKFLSML